jgi:gliding motility-associated-like protein
LKTASQPQINAPTDKYACDEGNGFGSFDLSSLELEIIGNQSNLDVMFFDDNGNEIVILTSTAFQNTYAWSQNINVRVVNELNSLCFSETNFNLIVNELPIIADLLESYFLCNLEPFLEININNNYDSYLWEFEDGTTISNTFEAQLANAGSYTLTIGKIENGISCQNSFDFQFIRSSPPTISEVNSQELTNNNNFIEIIATGDGNFEYSIDGINYQESNYFSNINGGIYNVHVRDKLGCGEDSKEVILIDYPKFFTPNGDGNNDFWQIEGISRYPISKIFIFDRYGKLLKQLSPTSHGWDGTYNGKKLNSDDYWFTTNINNEINFSGHFTLKN